MYACPHCNQRLETGRAANCVTWRCSACEGGLAPLPLLRRTMSTEWVDAMWQAARDPGAAVGCRCPSCNKPTKEVLVPTGDGARPAIDVCTRCHVVWFDRGEQGAVPRRVEEKPTPAPTPKPLSPELAQAVTRFEIEHDKRIREYRRQLGKVRRRGRTLPESPGEVVLGFIGLPVEYEVEPARRTPWATYTVLVATALVAALTILGDLRAAVDAYGFIPADALRLGGLTLITSFFIHAGWFHLLGNLYFLWMVGDNVEDVVGRWRFLFLLLAATLAGEGLHAVITTRPDIPCVGASGGISGALAFYALRYPKAQLGMIIYWRWVRVPVLYWFLFWALLQVLGMVGTGRGVAYGAHVGGAAVGVLAWWFSRPPKKKSFEWGP